MSRKPKEKPPEDLGAKYPAFTCPQCRRVSYNPRDASERYCGNCHEFF